MAGCAGPASVTVEETVSSSSSDSGVITALTTTDSPATTTSTTTEQRPPTTQATTSCAATDERVVFDHGRIAEVHHRTLEQRSPAVLALHGFTGDIDSMRDRSSLVDDLVPGGAIVAFPQGRLVPDSVGAGWNARTELYSVRDASAFDDVAFLSRLVDRLVTEHCADPERVVIIGFSNGGGMTLRAICDPRTHDIFRAALTVSAAVSTETIADCTNTAALPLVAVMGTTDRVVPLSSQSAAPLLGQLQWFPELLDAFACPQPNPIEIPDNGTIVETSTESDDPACRSRLVLIGGLAHAWPTGWPASDVIMELAAG